MCGRFVSSSTAGDIAKYFDTAPPKVELPENYNVAPTSDIYVVYVDGRRHHDADAQPLPDSGRSIEREVAAFYWGLVPYWARDLKIGARLINARSETAATKNSFKDSLARRRCIIPMDSFYEWKALGEGRKKQPYRIVRKDGEMFAVAGLWSEWKGEVGGEQVVVRSTSMLTGDANAEMEELHHRMPVLLGNEDWSEWLDPTQRDLGEVARFLTPPSDGIVDFHPVSTEVNNARNEGRHLIDEVDIEGDDGGGQMSLL